MAQSGLYEKYDELADSGSTRSKRLDIMLASVVGRAVYKSSEPLKDDLVLAQREAYDKIVVIIGRQIIWMILDFFKTNRSLQEQYTYEDIHDLK